MLKDEHYQFLLNEIYKGGDVFIEAYDTSCQEMKLDTVKEWVAAEPHDVRYITAGIICIEDEYQEDGNSNYSEYRERMASEIFDIIAERVK